MQAAEEHSGDRQCRPRAGELLDDAQQHPTEQQLFGDRDRARTDE
jgi:hypothetical protein